MSARIRCDASGPGGCEESHPVEHEAVGDEGFEPGRWLGWLYLDVNNRLVAERELRFCSVRCLGWWIDWATRYPVRESPLDAALRAAREADADQLAQRRARQAQAVAIKSGGEQ